MKAILFDFGGTLDTNGIHWAEFFWDAYLQFKVPVTKKIFGQAYVAAEACLPGTRIDRTDNFSATVKAEVLGQLDYLQAAGYHFEPTLADRVTRYCIARAQLIVKEELPLIKRIAQRHALGVVSNYYGNLEPALRELGLATAFRAFIDSTVVGIQKPDPRIFQLGLDALHAEPGETYVVGDSYERDIVPAKEIGCVTIWLRGRSWKETLNTQQADYVILSLQELSSLLRI
jgi:HAD superfamily hydrolase (TIGR01509 family)